MLANFTKAYANALIQITGRNLLPADFTGDDTPDFPATWYWERALGYTKEEEKATWDNAIISSDSFWRDLEPLPGAQDALKQLSRLHNAGCYVFFITHRFGNAVRKQTETFLVNNGFAGNPIVIIAEDKARFINGLGIEFFIDDKAETIQIVENICDITHLFLKDAPYNRDCSAGRRIASVTDALKEVGLWQDKKPVGRPKKSSST